MYFCNTNFKVLKHTLQKIQLWPDFIMAWVARSNVKKQIHH